MPQGWPESTVGWVVAEGGHTHPHTQGRGGRNSLLWKIRGSLLECNRINFPYSKYSAQVKVVFRWRVGVWAAWMMRMPLRQLVLRSAGPICPPMWEWSIIVQFPIYFIEG